jgi:D-alanine--poly(phosphoribitol) ligase subunit 1
MQRTVLEYFENTVQRHPSKTAVVDQCRSLTFSDVQRHAQALAMGIVGLTRKINRPVGVFLPTKTVDSVLAFLAALYSGNFYVPLDIRSPVPRLNAILSNLEPEVVLSAAPHVDALVAAGLDPNRIVLIENYPPQENADVVTELAARTSRIIDTDPVYIIYTSGSTGVPKGVVIPHRGVIDYIDWSRDCFSVDERAVIGNQAPFYFDTSTLDIYLCFGTGATLVLIPEKLFMFPVKLIEFLVEKNVNFIFWVPAALVNVANREVLEKAVLPKLEKILFAGEIMPVKHLNYWKKNFPDALFANLYGPTEITVISTYYVVDRDFKENEALPIGMPCRNTELLILDGDKQVTEEDTKGELCVRGSSLAHGYWNNPEKTETAFTLNPLNPNFPERIYRTGDLVHLNERGEIMFDGRMDFQIKHMGYRIELGEIEHAVLALPEIGNACVLYDDAKTAITLFYEAKEEVSPGGFRRELVKTLPKYMLPTAYHHFEALPRNPNGKIDRHSLTSEFFC